MQVLSAEITCCKTGRKQYSFLFFMLAYIKNPSAPCTLQRISQALCTPLRVHVPIVGYLLFIGGDMSNKSDISASGHLSKDFWTSANLQCFRDKSLFSFSEYLRIYQENLTIRVLLFYGQCQEVFRTYLSTSFPRGERRLGYMLLFIFTLAFIEDVWTFILKCTLSHSSEVIWELVCIHLYTWKNSRVTKLWSKKCSMILYTCL